MAKCSRCGSDFDVEDARTTIDSEFGDGQYDDEFPEGDVCENCASDVFGTYMNAGAEIIDLMGTGYDPD